jgi:hypothetical protein
MNLTYNSALKTPVGFPSGQREQTVNLPATPSKVRILPPPLQTPSSSELGFFYCYSHLIVLKLASIVLPIEITEKLLKNVFTRDV